MRDQPRRDDYDGAIWKKNQLKPINDIARDTGLSKDVVRANLKSAMAKIAAELRKTLYAESGVEE